MKKAVAKKQLSCDTRGMLAQWPQFPELIIISWYWKHSLHTSSQRASPLNPCLLSQQELQSIREYVYCHAARSRTCQQYVLLSGSRMPTILS